MRKLFLPLISIFIFGACTANLIGTTDYIPMGPDGLSVQVENPASMPVFIYLTDIKEPWAPIGM